MQNLDLDDHPPPLWLALRVATAQSARDVWHKSLLLPALLELKVVQSEDAEAWKAMTPEDAAQQIPALDVQDLHTGMDVVQAMYYSEAR